jgi:hypothetical protein
MGSALSMAERVARYFSRAAASFDAVSSCDGASASSVLTFVAFLAFLLSADVHWSTRSRQQ